MRRRRRKYIPRKISGLTWIQKLGIENALEFAADRSAMEELDRDVEGFQTGFKISTGIKKLLATFRKKTKHMKKPKKRKKK